MLDFTDRVTRKKGKHPFPQPFTAFAALDKEAAEKLMSGRLSCHPLHDYGLWGDVDGRDGGDGAPSRFGFDPLEAATKCYETERGTVVNVDCGDARLFKAIRLHSLVADSAEGGWNVPDPRMAELGDTAVVILDIHEFVNRVAQALYAQFGYNCILLADKVEYFDPAKPQLLKCMFSKDRRFEWQQEFRILFCEATDRGPVEGTFIKSARRPPSVDLEIGGIGTSHIRCRPKTSWKDGCPRQANSSPPCSARGRLRTSNLSQTKPD